MRKRPRIILIPDSRFPIPDNVLLTPDECRAIVPALAQTRNPDVWAYRYQHDRHPWTLTVATHNNAGP